MAHVCQDLSKNGGLLCSYEETSSFGSVADDMTAFENIDVTAPVNGTVVAHRSGRFRGIVMSQLLRNKMPLMREQRSRDK
jgi:hypothetical protein